MRQLVFYFDSETLIKIDTISTTDTANEKIDDTVYGDTFG
jgi:hypothetical protein